MNRPPLEVADIVRSAGQSFVERSRKWINGQHGAYFAALCLAYSSGVNLPPWT